MTPRDPRHYAFTRTSGLRSWHFHEPKWLEENIDAVVAAAALVAFCVAMYFA